MLTMIVLLCLVSVWIEMKLLNRFSVVKNFIGKSKLAGVFLSLAISWALGQIFGAGGVIILIAGLGSTMAAEPFRRMLNKTEKTEQRVKTTKYWANNATETYKPILIIMKWIGIITSAPVWIPVYLHAQKKKREEGNMAPTNHFDALKDLLWKKEAA